MIIKIYTDATIYNKNNQVGIGILIIKDNIQHQYHQTLDYAADNHTAEFLAAIAGFKKLSTLANPDDTIQFFTDSRMVSDAIAKKYSKKYKALLEQYLILQDQFNLVISQWIPEKSNQGAHHLARQSLT
ncbi:reverse transcriptase-like protein [Weissella coleopterorum]|uniref:reverse transcriptase-like protein n=1 Tax=Weissella coleopterorum TaxID=2714949 RepID=UPI0031B5AFC7